MPELPSGLADDPFDYIITKVSGWARKVWQRSMQRSCFILTCMSDIAGRM